MDVLHPEGPVGNREVSLLAITTLLMLIVVLPVFGLTFWFAWRYRATATASDYAPNWAASKKLELAVWGVPFAIVVCLNIANWRSTLALNPYQPLAGKAPALVIDVVALNWKWLFIYPAQGIASINEVAIPAGRQVEFRITSDAEMNAFFIPRLGTQIYAMSGMVTQLHLLAKNPGRYPGFSANFSGPGFAEMRFTTLATDAADFAAWVARVRAAPATLDDAGYQFLTGGQTHVPVSYFGHVTPGLFDTVVAARGDRAKQLPAERTE
jgi:cytochrome o ubiquinol oxidase subunit 2